MEDYIIILIILAFAMLVGSTLGFGDSLIFISIASLFLDVRTTVVLMAFWTTALSVLNTIQYRTFIDKSLIRKYLAPGIIGIILGSFLLVISSTKWIEFFLGVFVLVFVSAKTWELAKERKIEQENRIIRSLEDISPFLFYTSAFSYGFLGGLIGASGPINVALLDRAGYKREGFIANFSCISIILTSFRITIYVVNELFPTELLVIFLTGFIVIFIMTKIGHWLTPKISKEKFEVIVLIILTLIGLNLIYNSLIN